MFRKWIIIVALSGFNMLIHVINSISMGTGHSLECCHDNMFILDNEIFTLDTFLFQDQLSAVEEESNAIAGSEVEPLKKTIADKDREIIELSGELQTLQAQLQTVGKYPSEEEEEEVYRLMVETSELTAKLVEAEGEKWERESRLVAAHQKMELLQQLIAELREKKSTASQVDCCVHCVESYEIFIFFLATNFNYE